MKPYELFIPLNFILSLSTVLLTWGVRVRKDKHEGFCTDPWGADWYVLWLTSSILYTLSLLYAFLRNKTYNIELGVIHGPMFVFTAVFTFVLFVMGFLYFSKPDKTCESLKVFDSILWAMGIIGGIVLRMRYPNRITKAIPAMVADGQTTSVFPANFKNLRY